MNYILLNKEIIRESDLKLTLSNRGFFFGDGFFETIKIIDSKIFNFNNHYNRIVTTLSFLDMHFFIKKECLRDQLIKLILKNNINKGGKLKIVFFRNSIGKYLPEKNSSNIIVTAESSVDNHFKLNKLGLRLDWYIDTLKARTRLSNFKTLNTIPSVLCAKYAKKKQIDDAILFNTNNQPIETSNANLFLVKNNIISTPILQSGCVDGTMRNLICNTLPIEEIEITKDMILEADEFFITNSLSIRWVEKIKNKEFKKCNIAKKLVNRLNKLV